jgi:hypothetical protein
VVWYYDNIQVLSAPGYALHSNRLACDRSDDDRAGALVRDMLEPVEPGALLLTMEWQFYSPYCPGALGRLSAISVSLCKSVFYGVFAWARRALNSQKRRFPAWAGALHHLRDLRPDLQVVDINLVRRRWYCQHLRKQLPALMKAVRKEEVRYLTQLRKFDYDEPYDTNEIQGAFIGLLNALVDAQAAAGKPIYAMRPVEDGVGSNYEWAPVGLLYQLREPGAPPPPSVPFLPKLGARRFVRHPFDIEGFKVCRLYLDALRQVRPRARAAG